MSTAIAKNFQIGADSTATNNFTIFQPATPDGTLRIGNGNTGITTGLVTLNSSGNLGLGVTPSAWGSSFKAVQINSNGVFAADYTNVASNAYQDGAGWKYRVTGALATRIDLNPSGAGGFAAFIAPVWNPATNPTGAISFTQAMTLDASGQLGIGATSPAGDLHVQRADAAELVLQATNSGGRQWLIQTGDTASGLSGSLRFYDNTAATERARIDSSGNLGIGTTVIRNKIQTSGNIGLPDGSGVLNNVYYSGAWKYVANGYGSAQYADGAGNYVFLNAPNNSSGADAAATLTERARIDSSGNLLVGTTGTNPIGGRYNGVVLGSGGSLDIRHASNTSDWGISSTSGTIVNFYSDNGSAAVFAGFISVNGNTTSYASVSDYRLKENIQPMTGALAKVAALKPCTYNWKADGSEGEGFIAHELAEVVPQCVTGEKDAVDAEGKPVYQGIDTSFLVATLTAALQELNAKVEAQAAEIAALKGAA